MQEPDRHTWDTTVVFVERQGRWWWNAWNPVDEIERSGYADTREEATGAVARAVLQASS